MGLLSDLAETLVIKYIPASCLALASAACLSLSDPQGFSSCHPVATWRCLSFYVSGLGRTKVLPNPFLLSSTADTWANSPRQT